jgi:plastocyanin
MRLGVAVLKAEIGQSLLLGAAGRLAQHRRGQVHPHNFTFEAAHVAENLPADKTATIELTAPAKPGLYRFYCKYHLQMMEGAITVR